MFLSEKSRKLWAKSTPKYKSLWHHMLDSGICATLLAENMRFSGALRRISELFTLTKEESIHLVAYLAAIHDCYGKAHPAFQKKSEEYSKFFCESNMISKRDTAEGYRHERYGEDCYATVSLKLEIPQEISRIFASVIGLHHQGKWGKRHPSTPKLQKDEWMKMGDELHEAAIHIFNPPISNMKHCQHVDAAVLLLTSFVVLSDWIASSDCFAEIDEEENDLTYIEHSKTIAYQAVRQYHLDSGNCFPIIQGYQELWPHFSSAKLRPIQQAILTDAWKDAGLTIIEAPMGEGKTEAAAFFAARLCSIKEKMGIYFALPTAATSNQMHERIDQMLSNINRSESRLMHGMAWMVDLKSDETKNHAEDAAYAEDWLKPMRRAMLSENGVGTVDQAMMAAMPIKYSCLRMLGLSGKVLVIDEIHAYDAYMIMIIERLLEWCRVLEIPVILLSATLTAARRQSLIRAYGGHIENVSMEYPLITQVKCGNVLEIPVHGTQKQCRYQFDVLPMMSQAQLVAQKAVLKVENGGCLCVMMNTVAEAQHVYKEIRKIASTDVQLLLFHARMKAKDRNKVEKLCLKSFDKEGHARPSKAILVCTQVVEQSMDLDFDGMITEIAPIDLLLQRAGRVHRHDRPNRPLNMKTPTIEVLIPEDGKVQSEHYYGSTGVVYEPWLLQQTQKLLPRIVSVPKDLRAVIEEVGQNPGNISDEWAKMMFGNQLKTAEALGNVLPEPDADRFFGWDGDNVFALEEPDQSVSARTRLGDTTVRVAVLNDLQMENAEKEYVTPYWAQEVMLNSFTIRAKMNEDDELNWHRGRGLLRNVWFINENMLPIAIGQVTLDYDTTLGAVLQRGRNNDV